MAYTNSGPGPCEDAAVRTAYRALLLQADQSAVTLTINSHGKQQTIYLEPGKIMPVSCTIVSGTLTGVKGFIP